MFSKNLNYDKLLDNFLTFKRDCGYKYNTEKDILNAFYRYTKEHNESRLGLTKEYMEKWATLKVRESKKSLSNRVSVLREFAIYLSKFGYKVHILTPIKNAINRSFIPYVFSKEEIDKIFYEIDNYPISKNNPYNSNEVYPILFRFLYGCGLRISEALHIKIKDVDTITGKIEIFIAKNNKQRVIMISDSLKEICHTYKTQYLLLKEINSTFFQHKNGSVRSINQVNKFFRNILYKCKIPYLGRGKGPYLHNLRHTFACHSFYQMHTNGLDMNVSLPILSTYLGHEDIVATQRYLKLAQSIFPKLISQIEGLSTKVYVEVEFEKE
jgi:integrase